MRSLARLAAVLAPAVVVVLLATARPASADWADARKAFREGLKSKEWEKRRLSYSVIADFDGGEAAEEILAAIGREQHPMVLLAATKTLAGFQTYSASQVLGEAIRTGRGARKTYAFLALREQKGPIGKDDLFAALDQPDSQSVAQAAIALGEKKVVEAVPRLIALLQHKEWQVRFAAARGLRALGEPPPKDPNKPKVEPKSDLPPAEAKTATTALAAALEASQGADRGAMVAALQAITGKDFGYDPAAWKALAAGADAASITRAPKALPHAFGIPVYGRRVVVVIDHSTCSDSGHGFSEERLQEACAVPGARPVPWYKIRTRGHLMAAHAKRLVNDLPDGSHVELITAGTKARPLFARFNLAAAGTRDAVAKTLEGLKIDAGMDAYGALTQALDTGGKGPLSWGSGPDTVVFINCGNPWLAEIKDVTVVAGAIGVEGRIRLVPIHTVGVGNHPFGMLREIADRTGGTYADFSK